MKRCIDDAPMLIRISITLRNLLHRTQSGSEIQIKSPTELALAIATEKQRAARRQVEFFTLESDIKPVVAPRVVDAITDQLSWIDVVGWDEAGQLVVVYPGLALEQYESLAEQMSNECRTKGLNVQFVVVRHSSSEDGVEDKLLVSTSS